MRQVNIQVLGKHSNFILLKYELIITFTENKRCSQGAPLKCLASYWLFLLNISRQTSGKILAWISLINRVNCPWILEGQKSRFLSYLLRPWIILITSKNTTYPHLRLVFIIFYTSDQCIDHLIMKKLIFFKSSLILKDFNRCLVLINLNP